jgi:hypothetical protein
MNRMTTPVVIRHLHNRVRERGGHVEKHQELRGCLAAIAEFAVCAVLVVMLLALIGTGPW